MWKIIRDGVQRPEEIFVFTIVNKIHIGIGPKTALFIEKDLIPLENVKVWSSTHVELYFAMPSLLRVVM